MKFDLAAWGAELSPDRPAVWFNGRWYRYRDLNERATRLAGRLAASGIGYGARVGLLSQNHLAHFDLLFAAPKLGFTFVPFEFSRTPAELRVQAACVRPDLVFHETRLADLVAAAFDCPRASLDPYHAGLGHSSRQHLEPPVLSPESIEMILFADGADASAHPVLIPYRQTRANAKTTAMCWELGADDCAVQATSCADASIHVLSLPLLAAGGRVVLSSAFDPPEYLELVQRLGATAMFLRADMYRRLVADPAFGEARLDRMRWALCHEEACPESVIAALRTRGVPFRRGYGRTQVGVNCFEIGVEEAAAHPESIGRPMPHVDVEIRRDDGAVCVDGEVGELTFAGEGLCSGYLDPGPAWTSVFRDGRFWSGDLAWRDADGRHFPCGRRDDRYLSRGEPVYPLVLERAIERCFGVAECMVVAIPDVMSGQSGLAAVVTWPGTITGANVLRRELAEKLPAHAMPSVIQFVHELPHTPQGAPDRAALRRLLEAPDD